MVLLKIWFQEFEDLIPQIPSEIITANENFPIREPTFCPGCAHRNVFYALRKAVDEYQTETGIDSIIGGDIGCYTMSMSAPFETMDWQICMGAGVGIANGVGKFADPSQQHVVAMIGDSNLFPYGNPAHYQFGKK